MKLLKNYYPPYVILSVLYLFFIVFAFFLDSPSEVFNGLKSIILSSDILITDYMEVGGIGAALVNAALTSLLSLLLLIISGIVIDFEFFFSSICPLELLFPKEFWKLAKLPVN